MKPYVSSHLKDMNRLNVYRLFCALEETSKSEISKLTGISPPTVIKITNFLLEKELVEELGEGTSSLGRKPQMLRHRKDRYFAVGLVHEGDYIRTGIVNLRGELVASQKYKITESFAALLKNSIYNIINSLIVSAGVNSRDMLGIGIGLPGIYNFDEKIVLSAPLIGITQTLDISHCLKAISDYYQVNVVVDNDLNMEVLGEFRGLKLPSDSDLVYVSLGTGLGSGVILNGSLRRGCSYMCGEIGYMSFLNDYVADTNHAGWLETKINLNVLLERFGSENGEIKAENVQAAIEYVSIPVALCINNIIMCYDCGHVSIGGEVLELLGAPLFAAIKERVRKLSIGTVQLHQKSCANPGVIGAAMLVADEALQRMLVE